MKLILTGRHFEISPHLRKHVEERVTRLEKYNDHILDGEIVLFQEHVDQVAEGKIHVSHSVLTAKAESTDMYTSVTELVDKLLVQLTRHDGKLKDRKRLSQSR